MAFADDPLKWQCPGSRRREPKELSAARVRKLVLTHDATPIPSSDRSITLRGTQSVS